MRLIVPKDKVDTQGQKLIFLAGPIEGVEAWHDTAIETIFQLGFQGYVASPNYRNIGRNSKRFIVGLNQKIETLEWETCYLDLASKTGAAMFWLPAQTKPMPILLGGIASRRTIFPKPYARDTRSELSEYITRKEYDPSRRIIIGGEEGFNGYSVFKKRILTQLGPFFDMYSTLEKTCEEAVKLANS